MKPKCRGAGIMLDQMGFCCELPLVEGNVATVEQVGFCCSELPLVCHGRAGEILL